MGTALAIIAAGFVGDAIYQEVKNYKKLVRYRVQRKTQYAI